MGDSASRSYLLILGSMHTLRLAFRRLRRHPGFTLLNVFGLSVGLACAVMIGLFVRFELSFDRFHPDADRIVRIAKDDPGNEYLGTTRFALTPDPLADVLPVDLQSVERATQISFPDELSVERADGSITIGTAFATADFFRVFTGFELINGDAETALSEPGTIVLTQSAARRLFGDDDPIGQMLATSLGDGGLLTVSGVAADPPLASHLSFASLISMETRTVIDDYSLSQRWGSANVYTYALLRPDADRAAFAAKLATLGRKYLGDLDWYVDNPESISVYFAQPLTDLHLRSNLNFEPGTPGSLRYVYLVGGLGLLILLIAVINYVNLITAQAAARAREMGMRKALGAARTHLVSRLLGESVVLTAAAFGLALGIAYTLLPTFSEIIGRELSLGAPTPLLFWLIAGATVVGVGLVAGTYPALLLSKLDPSAALSGSSRGATGSGRLRDGLVVVQLAVTVGLLVSTLVVREQMGYAATADTGMERANVVSIPLDREFRSRYPALREAALRHPGVLALAAGQNLVDVGNQTGVTRWMGNEDPDEPMFAFNVAAQPGITDVFGLELVDGNDLDSVDVGSDGVLINETFARGLGMDDPVGAWVEMHGREMRIVGVLRDFHFQSFHQPIGPFALYRDRTWFWGLQVRIEASGTPQALAHLEETLAEFAPGQPFAYTFADEAYDRLYRAEARQARLFGYLTTLAVVLASLGLIGLAAFVTRQRMREIAVRKSLGATSNGLVLLLGRRFVMLVGAAFVVAAPLSVWAMQRWLDGFAYRITIGPSLLLTGGAFCLVVTLGIVSFQVVRAARVDPAQLLRHE